MRTISFVTLLLFWVSSFSSGNFRVPPSLDEDTYAEYLDKSHYEIAGVTIGYSALPEIIETLGAAEKSRGDHIEKQVCYRNQTQVIEFYISTVGFGYNVYENNPELKNCGTTTKLLRSKFGLILGISRAEVIKMLGRKSEIRHDKIWYKYWVQEEPGIEVQNRLRKAHNLSDNSQIWLDVYSSVSVKFENEKLVHFGVHTTETF